MAWTYIITNTIPWTYTTDQRAHDNMQIVWNFFRGKGMTEEAVAGIMGNMTYEGICNPGQVELGGDINDIVHVGRGLIGWTGVVHDGGIDKQKLVYWGEQYGTDWYDGQMQIQLIWDNPGNSQFFPNPDHGYTYTWGIGPGSYGELLDVQEAVYAYFWEAERGTASTLPTRVTMANFWLNEFHGTGPGQTLPLWMMGGREVLRRLIIHA